MNSLYKPERALSANFKEIEVFRSEKAVVLGKNNVPSDVKDYLTVIDNASALAAKVLQPIRDRWGPTIIDSWYRSPALNAAVGGAQTSAHLTGGAADCLFNNNIQAVYEWIAESGLPFDQVIAERRWRNDHFNRWLHIAHKRDNNNRHHALVSLDGKVYEPQTPDRLARWMLDT